MDDDALQPATMHHIVMVADAPLDPEPQPVPEPEIGQSSGQRPDDCPIPPEEPVDDDDDWSLQALAEALASTD